MSAQVVSNILSSGAKLRDYAKGVENNLRKVELDSIEVAIPLPVIHCGTSYFLLAM